MRRFQWLILTLPLFCSLYSVSARQPFYTDDADVTPRRSFHFETSNEFDWLQRSAFPNLRQNTSDFELDYGLFDDVEIGIVSRTTLSKGSLQDREKTLNLTTCIRLKKLMQARI
jgi:hypothetical protein